MNTEFIEALEELEREKGIAIDVLLEALEAALISAYKRNFGSAQNVRVDIDRETGEIKVFARKTVVEKVEDDRLEISLEEAQKRDPRYELGDIVEIEVTPRDFGRIAAQTAKQVVVQRIREAERGIIYEEFSNREGDIVTGIVQRQDPKNVYVDLGKTEAILAPSEQIAGEEYRHGDRIKTYIVEVKKTTKGPQILVSRTHPGLLKRLFELEVPEIHDGVVELKSVAREAGARSKIAVYSKDENVDPVGACVGPKGMRVQTIVNELKGEKIDIVKWSPDPARFVANALSPAKVLDVKVNEAEKIARVIVPDYQLSLAIGKEGQNARLAAKLTGWKIDIKSESQMAEMADNDDLFEENDDITLDNQDYAGEEYYEDEYNGEYAEGEYDYDQEDGEYLGYEEGYDENAGYEQGYEEYDENYPDEYDYAESYDADNDNEANYEENYENQDQWHDGEIAEEHDDDNTDIAACDEEMVTEEETKEAKKTKKKKKGKKDKDPDFEAEEDDLPVKKKPRKKKKAKKDLDFEEELYDDYDDYDD
ncbi:transcription termination factor NusA [Thermincola ferriacetica]